MTRTEHLLTILAEECAEVAQRCAKALRFGLTDRDPATGKTAAESITLEMIDLEAVFRMLVESDAVPNIHRPVANENAGIAAKREKVEQYLAYSESVGTLRVS